MSCSRPIDAAVLADYWLAALSAPAEEDIETHLFTCDSCGARLREVIALAEALRHLARSGSLRVIVSDTFLSAAARNGLRVREYAPPTGGQVECTVTAEDDLLIGRLAANGAGANRVDLCICDENGAVQSRLPDIPVPAGAGSIVLQESISFARALPTHRMVACLVIVDETGHEALLGEYIFNHTRSLPGPGTWQSL